MNLVNSADPVAWRVLVPASPCTPVTSPVPHVPCTSLSPRDVSRPPVPRYSGNSPYDLPKHSSGRQFPSIALAVNEMACCFCSCGRHVALTIIHWSLVIDAHTHIHTSWHCHLHSHSHSFTYTDLLCHC